MASNRTGYGKAVTRQMYQPITTPLASQAQITPDAAFAAVRGIEEMVMQAAQSGCGFALPQLGSFQVMERPDGQRALILIQSSQAKETLNGD